MLELVPLCTARVEVAPALSLGVTPLGARSIGHITGATFKGDRIDATLAHGAAADWMVVAGNLGVLDVRLTLRTSDDALILVRYGGRLDMSDPAKGLTVYAAPTFETGDARYAWLNRIQAIGKGALKVLANGATIDYEFFEAR